MLNVLLFPLFAGLGQILLPLGVGIVLALHRESIICEQRCDFEESRSALVVTDVTLHGNSINFSIDNNLITPLKSGEEHGPDELLNVLFGFFGHLESC